MSRQYAIPYLAVQSVTEFRYATGDLVKVHRFATTIALENVKRHAVGWLMVMEMVLLNRAREEMLL